MITFGKKITFRPIAFGLVLGLFTGSIFSAFNTITGVIIGLIFFSIVTLGYYGANLELNFSYWQVKDNQIQYYDLTTYSKRVKTIFLMRATKMASIPIDKVQGFGLVGFSRKYQDIGWGIPVSAYQAIESPVLLRIKNPKYLIIKLNTGEKIMLDLTRDFEYNSEDAQAKLDKVIALFNNSHTK